MSEQEKDIASQGALSTADAATLRAAIAAVVASTKSHLDGRDLLAELHPRRMLDIKRRVDGMETWFEGDWLSNVWDAVKAASRVLESAGGSPFESRDDAMRWAWSQNAEDLQRRRPGLFAGGVDTNQGATEPEVSQSQSLNNTNGLNP